MQNKIHLISISKELTFINVLNAEAMDDDLHAIPCKIHFIKCTVFIILSLRITHKAEMSDLCGVLNAGELSLFCWLIPKRVALAALFRTL